MNNVNLVEKNNKIKLSVFSYGSAVDKAGGKWIYFFENYKPRPTDEQCCLCDVRVDNGWLLSDDTIVVCDDCVDLKFALVPRR